MATRPSVRPPLPPPRPERRTVHHRLPELAALDLAVRRSGRRAPPAAANAEVAEAEQVWRALLEQCGPGGTDARAPRSAPRSAPHPASRCGSAAASSRRPTPQSAAPSPPAPTPTPHSWWLHTAERKRAPATGEDGRTARSASPASYRPQLAPSTSTPILPTRGAEADEGADEEAEEEEGVAEELAERLRENSGAIADLRAQLAASANAHDAMRAALEAARADAAACRRRADEANGERAALKAAARAAERAREAAAADAEHHAERATAEVLARREDQAEWARREDAARQERAAARASEARARSGIAQAAATLAEAAALRELPAESWAIELREAEGDAAAAAARAAASDAEARRLRTRLDELSGRAVSLERQLAEARAQLGAARTSGVAELQGKLAIAIRNADAAATRAGAVRRERLLRDARVHRCWAKDVLELGDFLRALEPRGAEPPAESAVARASAAVAAAAAAEMASEIERLRVALHERDLELQRAEEGREAAESRAAQWRAAAEHARRSADDAAAALDALGESVRLVRVHGERRHAARKEVQSKEAGPARAASGAGGGEVGGGAATSHPAAVSHVLAALVESNVELADRANRLAADRENHPSDARAYDGAKLPRQAGLLELTRNAAARAYSNLRVPQPATLKPHPRVDSETEPVGRAR